MTKTTGAEPLHTRRPSRQGSVEQRSYRPWPLALAALILIVLAIPGALLVAPGFRGPDAPAPAPTAPAWQQAPATLSAPQVLAPLQPAAPVPGQAAVTAQVDPVLKADGGGTFTGMVQDALTGQVLFDRGGAQSRVPASNLKLLTAVAALRTLGPDHRFTTKVVQGPAPGQVVLVGGGDVLLGAAESQPEQVMGHAGLATLAAATVHTLQASGATGEIKVLVDDSLFTGPALNPNWQSGDVEAGEIAPLYPLALNSARFDPAVTTGPRPQDSAMAAAQEFAARLRTAGAGAGLAVAAAVDRSPGASQANAALLAAADSATVAEQVNLMLQVSDNYLAETMGRMAAVATGRPGSNDGATAALAAEVPAAGISPDAMNLVDVCGLAMGNQVSARQFAEAVRAITTGTDTRLRAALDGFPVGGLTGTLDTRYGDATTSGGAGLVRAKTGTLNTVLALSGYVVDADGRLLVFSFLGNGLTPGAAGNKEALDRAATALAGCGCR
ncbi:D-alanyl-D-alanine carboxypeptidase/D-alanyl-D-alanine-endopeptidase (penicillin-binding protein 4) [Pseudarthrobacter defluvii]|uniref:D-alanyl-D-alanine carboxypeptidase/D-alanyl-D-alanine endopeptidase n=1 Tax=Pseudarthrobacter defluvii TaxID=410837 RepID=UPI00277EB78A|nr:D-alanyl-D-alanine carboxypeptidase/D-alanyl-D-alanine-endopeptidase [Pseudarthrobacter defluvii]MDQ0771075.1 D-alanyl-D-alanine carboxypeptidase/D-alanyl-D-alanine-endopeptidase (penicillin-binding protein 4) [Pseudarthrobacter defluvii]